MATKYAVARFRKGEPLDTDKMVLFYDADFDLEYVTEAARKLNEHEAHLPHDASRSPHWVYVVVSREITPWRVLVPTRSS